MTAIIVDGNALLHRAMRVGAVAALETKTGKPTGGFFASLKSIHGVLNDHHGTSAYVVFDSGISKRRRELLPQYKGPRYRSEGDPYFEVPDEEHTLYLKKFRLQRYMLQYALPKLGVRTIRLKEPYGWEADDLIYLLTKTVPSNNVLVVSDDKDMLQLVSTSEDRCIQVLRPIAKQLITQDNFEDYLEYPQSQELLRKAILGDASDNIPKVPGCGKKGVDSIFCEGAPVCEYPFGDFFIWCMDHRYKKVRSIADNLDIVLRNYELMCFDLEDMTEARDQLQSTMYDPVSVDLIQVRDFLTKLELSSIVKFTDSVPLDAGTL